MPEPGAGPENERVLGTLPVAGVVRTGGGGTSEQASEPVNELGPVDWIVVEFPGSRFKGEIAPALGELVERGIVRVLDLLLIRKGEDGTLDFHELSDLDESRRRR